MGAVKVWLCVMAGTFGGAAVWGTGAGVDQHMYNSRADCMRVARVLEGVGAQCVYTTVVVKK